MFNVTSKTQREKPPRKDVTINGQRPTMEIDTGASFSVINEVPYHQLWPRDNTQQLGLAESLNLLKLNWADINHVHTLSIEALLETHSELFSEGLGTWKGVTGRTYMGPDDKPCFFNPRPVSYAMCPKVDQEVD